MRRVVAVTTVLVLAASPASLADGRGARDAEDYGGRFDIKAVRHSHGPNEGRVRHAVRMFGEWRNRALRRHHYVIGIYFDINRKREERQIWIEYRRRELRADMIVLKLTRSGKVRGFRREGPVRVTRPTDRSVRVAFNVSRLNLRGDTYHWTTVLTPDGVCPGSCDSDFAPDKGMIDHAV
jgi:hypothetical protein